MVMRLHELMGKEIINIYDGTRLGMISNSDLLFDEHTGAIEALFLPGRGLSLMPERQQLVIPWEAIKKIGLEVIIIEVDYSLLQGYRRRYAF